MYKERTRVADGPIGKADNKLSVTEGAIMSSQGQDEDNIIIMCWRFTLENMSFASELYTN